MSTPAESYINNLSGVINAEDSALHQGLYDFFPGLVYVYDVEKKQLSYINKKVTEALGYSYDDISASKNDLEQLIFNEDRERVKKELLHFQSL